MPIGLLLILSLFVFSLGGLLFKRIHLRCGKILVLIYSLMLVFFLSFFINICFYNNYKGLSVAPLYFFQWFLPFFSYLYFINILQNDEDVLFLAKGIVLASLISMFILLRIAQSHGGYIGERVVFYYPLYFYQPYQYISQTFSGLILGFLLWKNNFMKLLLFSALFWVFFTANRFFWSDLADVILFLGVSFLFLFYFMRKISLYLVFSGYWMCFIGLFFIVLFFGVSDFGQRVPIWLHHLEAVFNSTFWGFGFLFPGGVKARGHNQLLNAVLQGGIFAGFVVALLILLISWKAFKLLFSLSPRHIAVPIAFFLLSQVTLCTVTTVPFEQPFPGSLIWTALAMAEVLLRQYRQPPMRSVSPETCIL